VTTASTNGLYKLQGGPSATVLRRRVIALAFCPPSEAGPCRSGFPSSRSSRGLLRLAASASLAAAAAAIAGVRPAGALPLLRVAGARQPGAVRGPAGPLRPARTGRSIPLGIQAKHRGKQDPDGYPKRAGGGLLASEDSRFGGIPRRTRSDGPGPGQPTCGRQVAGGAATLTSRLARSLYRTGGPGKNPACAKWREIARWPCSWRRVSQGRPAAELSNRLSGGGWASKMPPARFF